MPHIVYAIIDPRDSQIFYIGRTSNFDKRKRQHIETGHGFSGPHIAKITGSGVVPLFAILEHCPTQARALAAETYWIEVCRSRGLPLLNKENPHAKGPASAGKLWTPAEDKSLLALCRKVTPISKLIPIFQRTRGSIQSRIRYLKARDK